MGRPKSQLGDIRTSPRSRRILQWLRRKPTPVRVTGETEDGEEVTCAISHTGPAQWTDTLGVVRKCVSIKALDKDGSVLRALDLDPDDPELKAESELDEAIANVAKGGVSVPIISVDVPKLVDNIARNMREVAIDAARANGNAYKEGFAAMVSVVNIALGLLVGVEQRLARAEQALEATSGEPDAEQQRTQMAMLALQRAMGGGAAPSNGAGPMDMAKLMQLAQLVQQQGATEDHENGGG